MTRTICTFVLAAAIVSPAAAWAQTSAPIFDMKGTWTGYNEGLVDGLATHHPADVANTPAGKYRIRRQNFTYKFDGQEGRLFWGTMGSEQQKDIRILGTLSIDGKTVYMVSKEGYIDGTLIDVDTIESCYRHVNPQSAVIGCNLMKRQK